MRASKSPQVHIVVGGTKFPFLLCVPKIGLDISPYQVPRASPQKKSFISQRNRASGAILSGRPSSGKVTTIYFQSWYFGLVSLVKQRRIRALVRNSRGADGLRRIEISVVLVWNFVAITRYKLSILHEDRPSRLHVHTLTHACNDSGTCIVSKGALSHPSWHAWRMSNIADASAADPAQSRPPNVQRL